MNYDELEKYLFSIGDEKFSEFSKKLSNSDYLTIGVKNPVLKQIIKEHIDDMELNTDDFKLGIYLEIDFIYYGLSLKRIKKIEGQLEFLKNNIKNAKSWVITDCMSSFMKKHTFNQFYEFFINSYNSEYTYERRMSYILALKHYTEKEILNIIPLLKINEEYMVMMAEAWLLSCIAIEYENEVYDYLLNCEDITLKRKTISKICDSFRYNEKSKNRFKELRSKK